MNRAYISRNSRSQVTDRAQKNQNGQFLDQKTNKSISNSHYLHRSYIRKSTREEVLARAERNEKGQLLDANTKEPIEGKYDIGHKTGHEFRTARDDAESKNLTQQEFNDLQNNPDHLQIEDPHENRSHKYEASDTPINQQSTAQDNCISADQTGQTDAQQLSGGSAQSHSSDNSSSQGNDYSSSQDNSPSNDNGPAEADCQSM